MRKISSIILHCAATPEGKNITTSTIRSWHINNNGWSDIGYHYVIELNGKVCRGRDITRSGAHTNGHNSDSIGICYVGGLASDCKTPKDTRTPKQRSSLLWLVKILLDEYNLTIDSVHVHNEYANKACPSFSRETFLTEYKQYFSL